MASDERDLWLEEMMVRWETSLLHMCYAYLHDRVLAEDAVQETFLKAWKGYDCFKGVAAEKTWIIRIAINPCKDLRRSVWFRHTDHTAELPEGDVPFTYKDDMLTRAVMDSRLSFLKENSTRRARIRQTIRNEGEPQRKQKMAAGIALTALAVVIMAGIALASGLNLFGNSGNKDIRVSDTILQAPIVGQWVIAAGADANDAAAYITNTYYDNNSLIVGYAIENGTWWGPFTPTEQQLANMTKTKNATPTVLDDDPDDPLLRQYVDAVQNGTRAGLTIYTLIADNRTLTDTGMNLGIADKTTGEMNDGTAYTAREYAKPQLAGEYLNIKIPLRKTIVHLYFDGKDAYRIEVKPEDMGAMTALVWRSDAPRQHMTGTGTCLGVPVTVEATVSASYGVVTLTVYDAEFPVLDDEYWYRLMEERNDNAAGALEPVEEYWYELMVWEGYDNDMRMGSTTRTNAHTITASFLGNSRLPKALTAMLLIRRWDSGALATQMIALIPETDPASVQE